MPTDNPQDILARAKQRAIAMKLPYAGALLPAEAYALVRASVVTAGCQLLKSREGVHAWADGGQSAQGTRSLR